MPPAPDTRGATVAALFLAVAVECVGQAPEAPIDPVPARRAFDEVRAIADRDGGRLWGVRLDGPLLLVEPRSRSVAANAPDAAGILRPVPGGGVFTGTLPPDLGIANTALEWNGVRWSMIMWPLPEDPRDRARLLMHELFHRVQPELGHVFTGPDNAHLDSTGGRLWLRLELRALRRASDPSDPKRLEAAKDAILFRRYRRSLFAGAADAERALEFNEGLAEYTGVRLADEDRAEAYGGAARALRDGEEAESFVRSFAYLTGPTYGLLLDDLGPGWRSEISPRRGLDDLLLAALRVEPPAVNESAALRRAASYGHDEVAALEAERERERQAWASTATGRFVDGPVLVIPMRRPRFEFDPGRVRALGVHGTVYERIEVRDVWGVLRAEGGALWTPDFRIVVPAPGDAGGPAPRGDGWALEPAAGWSLEPGPRPGDFTLAPPASGVDQRD